ncbi:MAG TPA: nucleotidyl transferase AbiEii/AbiGii toxin family protein [Gemmataceae bacterium]|jgi:hypothetical protein|nr:nucleotidyl transferase AbiEii/AbiGii toxin family protein [Gemmataceae bacterium]
MRTTRRRGSAQVVPSDPAWEAAKAARRNLDHNDAVQESAFLEKQYRALWSSQVAASPVDLNQILQTLTHKKVPFVLTGAHALGGWTGRPRATHDIDILVKGGRNHARAIKVIKALYPQLEVRDFAGVTAFFIPGEKQSVIDVTYPHRADIEETLADPVWTEDKVTGLRYRIPSLEAALANKYGAMLTPNRDPQKRLVDAADFGWMVKHSMDEGRQPIDLHKLAALGEKVWPGGGGTEILRFVEQVQAGTPINLDPTGRFGKQTQQ